jgi:hypothetical protein
MRHRTFAIILLMMAPSLSLGDIYQCQQANGQTLFADRPCGQNAQPIEATATRIGGRLDTGTDVQTWQPSRSDNQSERTQQGCPQGYINSTRLRHLRVKQQVQAGMSRKQVRYILGEPDLQDGQWWVYERKGQETGRYRIRGGCLDKWR